MDPPHSAEPTLLVLPVMAGVTRDFEALVSRVRDFVRFRETPAGPWLFDPREHGQDIWDWVARTGFGDSCRDSRILDEFIELIFAHDPDDGVVSITVWRPAPRSTLTTDSMLLDQLMRFISVHLIDPEVLGFMRMPGIMGLEAETGYATGEEVRRGIWPARAIEDLVMNAYALSFQRAGAEGHPVTARRFASAEEAAREGFRPLTSPSTSLLVPDWLEVLLRDPVAGERDIPASTVEMDRRMAALHALFFDLDLPAERANATVYQALFARVVERTNALRRLYRKHARMWPALPVIVPSLEVAHLTVCAATPDLARLAAEQPCGECEGCSFEADLTLAEQLELDLAS